MVAPLVEPDVHLFDEFESWFREIVDQSQPDLIVAIARGAARLLELHAPELDVQLCSQHAIPFLNEVEVQDKRILVFDDSIIFGSTMAEVAAYVESRGGIVSNAAYVGDESFRNPKNPNLALLKPLIIGKELGEEDVRMHHAALVHDIYQGGLDLNLDFPTLKVSIGEYSSQHIPFISELLRQSPFLVELKNVTHPVVGYNGVERWTASNEFLLCLKICENQIVKRPNSKVRITFVPSAGDILFTPIVPLALNQGVEFCDVQFNDEATNSKWRNLPFSIDTGDRYYRNSLLRLICFFEATIQCKHIAEQAELVLKPDFDQCSYSFVEREPDIVLGKTLSREMSQLFDTRIESEAFTKAGRSSIAKSVFPPSPLADKLATHLAGVQLLQLQASDANSTLLAKTFQGLRELTDSQEVRDQCGDSSRLKQGLSIEDINYVLRQSNISRTDDEISCAIDFCIDRALVVPKNLERDGWMQRLFYCGEDGENDPDDQLQQKLHEAATEIGGSFEISKFDFQKICATAKHLMDDLPLQTTPNRFGMTCIIGEKDLITWVTPKENAPFLFKENKKGNLVLVPNGQYKPKFSNTWNPQDVKRFFENFQCLYQLFTKLTDEEKLLVSTCGTIERCFDAIAFEIHCWAGKFRHVNHQMETFDDGVYAAITDLESETDSIGQDAIQQLYWSIVYSEECQKKLTVWRNRQEIRQKIERRVDKMNKPALRRWWNSEFQRVIAIAAESEEYEKGLCALDELAQQVRNLTAIATRTLIKLGCASRDQFFDFYQSRRFLRSKSLLNFYVKNSPERLQSKFNSVSNSLTSHWGARKLPHLHVPDYPSSKSDQRDWALEILERARDCRRAIAAAIDEVAPALDTKTNARRFSPGLNHELSASGKGLRIRTGVYVVSGVSDSIQNNEAPEPLKELLRNAIADNERLYVDTGSPGRIFKAYSGYPADIASLSEAIQKCGFSVHQVIQFGAIRSKMPMNDRNGTIVLAPELDDESKDALGRLDQVRAGDPNIIAFDEQVGERIKDYLNRGTELVAYDNDAGSLLVLHAEGSERGKAEKKTETRVDERNIFRKEGDVWRVRFGDESSHIKDRKGMTYLHMLLSQPQTSIPAVSLVASINNIDEAMYSGSSGEILDKAAIEQCQERALEIAKDIAEARARQNDAEIELLTNQLEAIEGYVKSGEGLNGRQRVQSDAEKVRKSVGNAVDRAIEFIREYCPTLGNHLDNCVSKGIALCYTPETTIEWLTH